MKVWTVTDVMSTDVVFVGPQTPYREIVDAVMSRGFSAVPVVDRFDRIIGVVSEADLLCKVELAGELPDRRVFAGQRHRNAKVKANALTADGLMTSPAVTVFATTTIVDAAKAMDREKVKSLPVINLVGRLVGIVSRSDLLKVHLRPDEEIRRDIIDAIISPMLPVTVKAVTVEVNQGVVRIAGELDRSTLVEFVGRMVAGVSGVVAVTNELTAPLAGSRLAGSGVGTT
jgi:CBS domain-containing protein